MQKAFEEMKVLLTTDALTTNPDHDKPFKIYTDASDYQLGACIVQEHNGVWRPEAYYSRTLNKAQKTCGCCSVWNTEKIPWQMRLSVVVLIPKGGNDNRGIGLLEVAWKVLEGVLDGCMKGIALHDALHGFRQKRGCGTGSQAGSTSSLC